MDFEFNEEQVALADSVRRFLSEKAPISPYVRSMLDDPRGTTDAVWQALADLGLTGLLAPAERGGSGMGLVDLALAIEELGKAAHPGPFLASAVGAITLVTAAGSDADHAALLPALADGSRVGTVALLERGQGDWRAVATTATPQGDGFVLTGHKPAVADAAAADLLLVSARTPDGALGVFAVERADAQVTPVASVDGTRKLADVALDGTPARRLGDGDASTAVARTFDLLSIGAAIDAVGAAEQAMAMAVDYAKERKQFGQAIGSFQAVQHLCADMLRQVELARAGAYYAAWAADEADPAERRRAAAMVQAFVSEQLPKVTASAIQVFGGIGFTWEHDVHLLHKRVLTAASQLGSADDHLDALADIVLSA